MKKADILISNKGGVYSIKVDGRATFECTPPLRSLAKNLDQISFSAICVDLKGCTGMDSTFMGILAMLGLRAKKVNAEMVVLNVGDSNMALLHGLGLKKLFSFGTGELSDIADDGSRQQAPAKDSQPQDKVASAQTVLEAHKALMDVDGQNVKKFEKVVDLVQKDLDRLKDGKG